jgi:hypothetical protein
MVVADLDAQRSQWRTRTIIIANGVYRLALFPEFGAKIYSLIHEPTGKELLWRTPQYALGTLLQGFSMIAGWVAGTNYASQLRELQRLQLWRRSWLSRIQARSYCFDEYFFQVA